MTAAAIPDDQEAAISTASAARQRCVCPEGSRGEPCECFPRITRDQVGRLRAYTAQHPERAIICSEIAGEWMSALHSCLPPGDDPILAWMSNPYALSPAAELRHSRDIGELLDMLGAPPAAAMS